MESGFGKSLFGYKKEDVQRSISQLETESQQRIKALEEELESVKNQLRASESARTSLQQKLEEANKKESAIVDLLLSAREKAVQIEEEARQQADQKLKDIDQEYAQKQREMDQMRQKYSSFQQDFKGLLGRYTGMLGHLPELVFRDEEKALTAGTSGSSGPSGIMAQLPPPAAGEWQRPAGVEEAAASPWSGAGSVPAGDAWQMPAAETDRLKKPEPVAETPRDMAYGPETMMSPGGAATMNEDGGETSEFRKALSSLNKLSYEPTIEEPWAMVPEKAAISAATAAAAGVEAVPASASDRAPELAPILTPEPTPELTPKLAPELEMEQTQGLAADRTLDQTADRTPVPEESAIPAATASLLEDSPLSVPGPQEPLFDPQYKPFTPFARKADQETGLVFEKAPLPSRLEASAPVDASAPAEAHAPGDAPLKVPVENPLDAAPLESPFEAPFEPPFKAPAQAAEYKAVPDIEIEPRPSLPDSVVEARQEPLPFRAEEAAPIRPGPAGDSGSGLPYKPWEDSGSPAPVSSPGAGGLKDAAQPFAEGASLKELLERHRLEMQRRNQGGADQQDGTLHVEMSEEDKKFWS